MDALNLFTAENVEGRIDVAAELGSSGYAIYVYDVEPQLVSVSLRVRRRVAARRVGRDRRPHARRRADVSGGRSRVLPARAVRRAQGDEPRRRAGADAALLERADAGGL